MIGDRRHRRVGLEAAVQDDGRPGVQRRRPEHARVVKKETCLRDACLRIDENKDVADHELPGERHRCRPIREQAYGEAERRAGVRNLVT